MRYDPHTALIVVDVQNDFAHPDGTLYIAEADEAIPRINEEVGHALAAGAAVLYTRDWHPPDTPHFERGDRRTDHCVRDTWGAEFCPALHVVGDTIDKGTGLEDGFSGFSTPDPDRPSEGSSALAARLHKLAVERIVVVGLAYGGCVKATALDALRLGFDTTVIRDASGSPTPEGAAQATEALTAAGATVA
jgi:nicotinamidase/pyrazinamidase